MGKTSVEKLKLTQYVDFGDFRCSYQDKQNTYGVVTI